MDNKVHVCWWMKLWKIWNWITSCSEYGIFLTWMKIRVWWTGSITKVNWCASAFYFSYRAPMIDVITCDIAMTRYLNQWTLNAEQSCSSSTVVTPRHCAAAAAARRHVSQTIADASGKLSVCQSLPARSRQVFHNSDIRVHDHAIIR